MSNDIAKQLMTSQAVDLATVVRGDWDRVCVIAPYANRASASKTLGFDWDSDTNTSIQDSDGETLLVFAKGKSVTYFLEHPRNVGDFAYLGGECFPRSNAKFKLKQPGSDWPSLVPSAP